MAQVLKPEELAFLEAKEPSLAVRTWCGVSCSLRVQGITKHGIFQFIHNPNTDRSWNLTTHRLPSFPLWINADVVSGTVRRGNLYIRLSLLLAGFEVGVCYAGYLYFPELVLWPPGKIEDMTSGPGLLRSVTGTDPAAGAEISETVPTNTRWRIIGVRFTLVTNATVATRRSHLVLDDGAMTLLDFPAGDSQLASLTRTYNNSAIGAYYTVMDAQIGVIIPPDLLMFQGWRIRTLTANLQAGDNYGAPQLFVEEWIEE